MVFLSMEVREVRVQFYEHEAVLQTSIVLQSYRCTTRVDTEHS